MDLLRLGIDLPRDIGTRRLPWSRLARLITHADLDSALIRARRGNGPTPELLFMRRSEFWLHLLYWTKTKDSQTGSNPPRMVPLPGDPVDGVRRDARELEVKLARRRARRLAELARMNGSESREA